MVLLFNHEWCLTWATTGSQEREPGNHPSEIVVFIPFHPNDFDVLYPIYLTQFNHTSICWSSREDPLHLSSCYGCLSFFGGIISSSWDCVIIAFGEEQIALLCFMHISDKQLMQYLSGLQLFNPFDHDSHNYVYVTSMCICISSIYIYIYIYTGLSK